MDFLAGYKTYIGIVVALAGVLGISKFFGGDVALTELLTRILEIGGLLFAAYGRYTASKRN